MSDTSNDPTPPPEIDATPADIQQMFDEIGRSITPDHPRPDPRSEYR